MARRTVQERVEDAVSEAVSAERKRVQEYLRGYEFSADAYTYDVVMSVLADVSEAVGS